MTGWLFLAGAILFEVAGTTCMKLSAGLTKPLYTALIFVCYGVCFSLFSVALKSLEVSVAYAIWAGLGTAAITAIGFLWFDEPITWTKGLCIALIILGVIGLRIGPRGAEPAPPAVADAR